MPSSAVGNALNIPLMNQVLGPGEMSPLSTITFHTMQANKFDSRSGSKWTATVWTTTESRAGA